MIAYNFQTDFAPQLTSGEKTLTLRRDRKAPSRHADVGEPIGLWTGQRSKAAQRQGAGIVQVRAMLHFSAAGITRTTDVRFAIGYPDSPAANLTDELAARDGDAFARRDGFENYAALWAWHVTHLKPAEKADFRTAAGHAFGTRPRDFLVRNLIAWRPLTAEQLAELDSGRARLEEIA